MVSHLLFSFIFEEYIVGDICGLSCVSSCVLYTAPTYNTFMQVLMIRNEFSKKFKKSCFRRKKDTWHIESNHILQPPEYLIIFVNWLSYNNYVTKIGAPCLWTETWCLVPINAACRMHATVIHSVRSMYSTHYTTSGKCFKNTPFWFLANCTQVVVVEGESRRPELVTSGVPQG